MEEEMIKKRTNTIIFTEVSYNYSGVQTVSFNKVELIIRGKSPITTDYPNTLGKDGAQLAGTNEIKDSGLTEPVELEGQGESQ